MLVKQVGEEGDGLDGLSKPHLISKDNTVASKNEKKKNGDCLTLPNLLHTWSPQKLAVTFIYLHQEWANQLTPSSW